MIITKYRDLRKTLYTVSMSIMKLPPVKHVIANYCGGLGYYAFHFAWILLAFTTLTRIMQYVIPQNQPVLQTPAQTTAAAVTTSGGDGLPTVVVIAISAFLLVATLVLLILLPYWIGYLSRGLSRWLLRQTSWGVSLRGIQITKQLLSLLAFVVSVMVLFQPAMDTIANLPFFLVTAACVVASLAFALQHILVTLWNIPERRVY